MMADLKTTPLPDAEIETMARGLCNDAAARNLAHASAAPSYDFSAERVKEYWRCLARAALKNRREIASRQSLAKGALAPINREQNA